MTCLHGNTLGVRIIVALTVSKNVSISTSTCGQSDLLGAKVINSDSVPNQKQNH